MAKKSHQEEETPPIVPDTETVRAKNAMNALQQAQSNVASRLTELEAATPAHQTLSDLIIKDILIVSSALFWPAIIYWLW